MYLYVKFLTKEEAIESEKKAVESANNWWDALSDEEKVLTEKTLALLYKQRKCEHNWVEGLYYDTPTEYCSECDLKK